MLFKQTPIFLNNNSCTCINQLLHYPTSLKYNVHEKETVMKFLLGVLLLTPLKPLDRISCNSVILKDIPCRCAYPQEILIQFFFSNALFELRNLAKIKDTTQNSLSAQLL